MQRERLPGERPPGRGSQLRDGLVERQVEKRPLQVAMGQGCRVSAVQPDPLLPA
ncbi:MAG: hypothetical protein LOD90_09725 [Symbiobacteriaceae bacterium]